jgi:predicted nucleic acid-binding protein
MTLATLASGTAVFVDANILIYHIAAHPIFGAACTSFVRRIEQGDVQGFTATSVMSEVAHKAMLLKIHLCGYALWRRRA